MTNGAQRLMTIDVTNEKRWRNKYNFYVILTIPDETFISSEKTRRIFLIKELFSS